MLTEVSWIYAVDVEVIYHCHGHLHLETHNAHITDVLIKHDVLITQRNNIIKNYMATQLVTNRPSHENAMNLY